MNPDEAKHVLELLNQNRKLEEHIGKNLLPKPRRNDND